MEVHNNRLVEKYKEVEKNEVRYEEIMTDDAEYIFVAYGLSARICHKAAIMAREKGIKAGMFRPITLFPYPYKRLNELADRVKFFLTVELNAGQMVEDVRLGVNGKIPVEFYGRLGGMVPNPEEIVNKLENLISNKNVN